MTRYLKICFLFTLLLIGVLPGAFAAVPKTLNYQGTLTDAAGQPVNGLKKIAFALYSVATGGTAFWTETQTLTLVDGRLSAVLGATVSNPLNPNAFTGETYIGIKVDTDTEMPRQKLSSVAYAFQAGDGGVPKGVIVMWSGAVTNVPSGWALCDGQNGTPNLRDRFVVGAGSAYAVGSSGGMTSNDISHSHGIGAEGAGTSSVDNHQHSIAAESPRTSSPVQEGDWEDSVRDDNDHNVSDWYHIHTVNSHSHGGTTGAAGAHSHTVDAHSHGGATGSAGTATLENRPPYYALAFIMKL